MHPQFHYYPINSDWPAIFSMYDENFDLKKGIIEKVSYERRAYESVDDRSHS